ncbi:MAG: efflux transporter outer membrane subunit [Leptothrix ochracea]|uniref:efflux transporter outer membrane subunit n=1 Tax=Leptothrix ochracea TaxID=735331 RepID=UPI0034E2183C
MKHSLTLIALAISLVGCASVGETPAARSSLRSPETLGMAEAAATMPWPEARWWQSYGDNELNRLIDQALAHQPNLRWVEARLQQAQAAVDGSRAVGGLQVNASLDMIDQRYSENGLVPKPLAGTIQWNNNAQIGLGWEWDLFGRQSAALEASLGQQRAAQAEAQAAQVLLVSQVTQQYLQLARILTLLELSEEGLHQREQMLALVRQRLKAGLDTDVEWRQTEGLIAQTRVEIAQLDESAQRSRHALAELCGLGPDRLASLRPRLSTLQAPPLPQGPAGLPADLLGRRADLVAQRWRVEAAGHEVEAARAQFYPNVNLMAFVGLSSLGLDHFVQAGSLTYGAGPALRLPIFDGGRLRANLSSRQAEVDAATEAYNATLLRALREVADELGSLQSLEQQSQAQIQATQAAEAAQSLAMQRYQAGLGSFITVLNVQTNVLNQRRALAEVKARQLSASVALSRALGGGYQLSSTAPTAAQP